MAGEPADLRCNGCGGELPAGTQCVAATCYHIFCTDCAQKLVERGEPCPLCDSVIGKSNVKLVCVLQPHHKCKLVLCGQTPEVIADAALTAINFYVEQQRLTGMYDNHVLKKKMDLIQTKCKEKLSGMQTAYERLRVKFKQAEHLNTAAEQDKQELQQKYAQKASQARKLQEMFKALQQENEELKRHLGMRGNAAGGNSVARPGAPVPRGGGHSGRQMSPFNGRTQMVTTVQHTQALYDTSPGSGSGLHMLAGHGSAVIGSGNNRMNPSPPAHMFGAATHGMGAVGQRPSTAGGMFAAVNVRAGGGGGGGGGGGLGLQGHRMAAFGTSPDAMMTM